jgi:hypothetical protein
MYETSIRKRRDLSARRERHFVASTVIAAAALALGAAGLGYSISAGESAKKEQRKALEQQTRSQQQQAARAAMQQRRSEMAMAGAQRKQPNVAGIMAGAEEAAGGPTSTMLTGPMGINPQDLNLGRSTLLGG